MDAWNILEKISNKDENVWYALRKMPVSDRSWYSVDIQHRGEELRNYPRVMTRNRYENHIRILIKGDNDFFWYVQEYFEPMRKKYGASLECIKVGNEYTKPIQQEQKKTLLKRIKGWIHKVMIG